MFVDMRNFVLLALALLLVSTAGAATAPDVLVVTSQGTMHLADASGAVSTSVEGVYVGADWSPDGSRLAYVSQSSGGGRIVVADADGSDAREVRQDDLSQGWNGPLVWVSSNEVAVHHRAPAASSYTLWIVPVDGGPRRLVVDPADLNFPLAVQPHGSLLVYSVTTPNGVRRALLDVRTGARRMLPFTAALVWSPDGGLLAAPASNGIELLRPDGTGRRTIDTGIPSSFLAWSPDGTRIAFASWRAFPEYTGRGGTPTRYDVYSVRIDGSDLRRLTSVSGDDLFDGGASSEPTWWPDGSRLFFKRQWTNPVFAMNSDGSCEAPWGGLSSFRSPVWRPGAGTAAGRQECSSVVVRLRTPLAEVSHRAALPLTIRLRNDGTRTLRDVQLSLVATYGALEVPGRSCGSGPRVTCGLGDLEAGRELVLGARTTFTGPGRTRVTASASYAGGGDVDPSDDAVELLRDVSPCDLLGTWGKDRLVGTSRGEWICARPGWDSIDGRGGNDRIEAGSGNDTVVGGTGRDRIDAGGGADTIRVRDGERDVVDCGSEADVVVADRKDVLRHCERVSRRAP
jgi:hypothetical protein